MYSARNRFASRSVVSVLAVILLALGGCDSGCTNEELERSMAPDRALDAVVFVRACGATTGPGVSVSIVPAGDTVPDEAGNVLRIKDPSVMAERAGDVRVRWVSADTLQIRYEGGRGVHLRESRYEDRVILYDVR